jgi:Fic family protein
MGERFILEEFEAKGNRGRLSKWCKKYCDVRDLGKMKLAHVEFEEIHPFADGNGRVGRILYNTQRVVADFDIKIFLESEKSEYYNWFEERRRKKDIMKMMLEEESI